MTNRQSDDEFTPEEAARRRDEALKRALGMPAVPHEGMKVGRPTRKATERSAVQAHPEPVAPEASRRGD